MILIAAVRLGEYEIIDSLGAGGRTCVQDGGPF
jgi:hypothetical protein